MKKYLIKGLLAIFVSGIAASCTEHDVDYVPLAQRKSQAYDQAFKDMIGGDVDPNQDWGFENVAALDGFDPIAAVRAMTRTENANANEWADPDKVYGGLLVPPALTPEQIAVVKKYFQTVPNITYQDPKWNKYFIQQVYKGHTDVPQGCATPEAYMALNGTTELYASDYMDHLAAIDEQKGIVDHINNFNHGDCGVNDHVLDNGGNANDGPFHTDKIMLMQNSTTKSFGYFNSNGSLYHNEYTGLVSYKTIMAALGSEANCLEDGWNRSFMGFDFEQMVDDQCYAYENNAVKNLTFWGDYYVNGVKQTNYVYQYNGKSVKMLSDQTNRYCGTLRTVTDEQLYSEERDANNNNAYLGKKLNTDVIDGLLRDGYLPIDNKQYREWAKVGGCADGYYSDWIVTLTEAKTPGGGSSTTTSTTYRMKCKRLATQGRVFCEDLGKIDRNDIDFNDVVFDARIWWTYDFEREFDGTSYKDKNWTNFKYVAEICLLAAGGTITSQLAENDVHGKFGVGVTTMVNTYDENANRMSTWENMATEKSPVTFTYDMTNIINEKGYINLDLIPIKVLWTNDDSNLGTMQTVGVLEANLGDVPHKICTPIGVVWPSERRSMSDTYKYFNDWAMNKASHPEFYNEEKKDDYLYTGNTTGLPSTDIYGREYFTVSDGNIYTNYTWEEVKSQTTYAETETDLWSSANGYVYGADGTGANNYLTLYSTTFNTGDYLRVYCTKQADTGWITFHDSDWHQIVGSDPTDFGAINGNGYVDIPVNTADKASSLSNGPTLLIAANNITITKIVKLVVSTSTN